MSTQVYKDMFESAVHIGHRTHRWNPRMKRYIYGEKNGIHIINLEKTQEMLDTALNVLKKAKDEGKTILFVSTKPQAVHVLEDTAKKCKMPYVISKWIPGLLTNFETVKKRIKYLGDLKAQQESGEFEKYTKKEVANLKKDIQKLELALGGVQDLKDTPDVVFLLDAYRDRIPAKEAKNCGIPVIAFVDTNADPELVDFPIPANDDALTSLTYLLDRVREAIAK